jgi:hypothetical protein
MSTISRVQCSMRNGRMCMNGKLRRMWKQSHPKLLRRRVSWAQTPITTAVLLVSSRILTSRLRELNSRCTRTISLVQSVLSFWIRGIQWENRVTLKPNCRLRFFFFKERKEGTEYKHQRNRILVKIIWKRCHSEHSMGTFSLCLILQLSVQRMYGVGRLTGKQLEAVMA